MQSLSQLNSSAHVSPASNVCSFFASYLLYPLLLISMLLLFISAITLGWSLQSVFAIYGGGRFIILLATEFWLPAKYEWKMTWASFRRDLKYVVLNGSVAGLVNFGIAWLAIDLSKLNVGILNNSSFFLEFIVLVLVFEFFQYWFHRYSHEGKGRIGQWLWKLHLVHHLPTQLYLLMHVVAHPLSMTLTLLMVNWPLVVLGAHPETIFLFNAVLGLQGLVSHFNGDMKTGWLNYILVGTELHRYHHSANPKEALNYGAMIPLWDLVFGTFCYHPQKLPEALGVSSPNLYPNSSQILPVLMLPFVIKKFKETPK